MKNAIMETLQKYCERQGIELSNMEVVAAYIENEVDNMLPMVIHNFGVIVED